jgi:hypothetical protein
MARTTSAQIESHIRSKREELRSNLEQLERRARSMVDWRELFRRNPALGAGVAVAAGFLLARVTARPRRPASVYRPPPTVIERRVQLPRAWENVQRTVIEIAAAQATHLLRELLLGSRSAPRARSAKMAQAEAAQRAAATPRSTQR